MKVGIYSLTGCQGCLFQFLINEDLQEILSRFKIVHFKPVGVTHKFEKLDLALVEGSVSTKKEEKKLKKIRKKSEFLIALGTCASWGGIQSIKNFRPKADELVYPKPIKQKHGKVKSLQELVKVDYFLRGCPFDGEELKRILKHILLKKTPRESEQPVCVECNLRENLCLLKEEEICLGPITYGGCDALCPTLNRGCDGCRGPCSDANVAREAELLQELVSKKEIKKLFRKYAAGYEKLELDESS